MGPLGAETVRAVAVVEDGRARGGHREGVRVQQAVAAVEQDETFAFIERSARGVNTVRFFSIQLAEWPTLSWTSRKILHTSG